MSQTYNLDEVEDGVEFILNEKRYRLRFPTTEEVLNAEKLTDSQEQLAFMYNLVEAIDKDAPNIKEALSGQNVKKTAKFNEMIKASFAGE